MFTVSEASKIKLATSTSKEALPSLYCKDKKPANYERGVFTAVLLCSHTSLLTCLRAIPYFCSCLCAADTRDFRYLCWDPFNWSWLKRLTSTIQVLGQLLHTSRTYTVFYSVYKHIVQWHTMASNWEVVTPVSSPGQFQFYWLRSSNKTYYSLIERKRRAQWVA